MSVLPVGVEVLALDLVGTLIYPEPDVATAYQHVGRRFGVNLTKSCLEDRFAIAMEAADWSVVGNAGQRDAWRQVVGQVFEEPPGIESLFSDLWDHFAQPSAWRIYADVEPCLAWTSRQGMAVCIASNFDGRLHAICEGLGLSGRCHAVWGSVDLGFAKPDTRFFDVIANRLERPPEQLCMVGDNWEHDFEAPRHAGWRAIWLCRAGSTGRPMIRSLEAFAR